MKFNVFEGSRRILYLVMALYATGVAFFVWNSDPYVSMTYNIPGPTRTPTLVSNGSCESEDAREYITRKSTKGREISITLCFKPVGEGPKRGIPYAVDGQMWLLNEKYSPDVTGYTDRVGKAFLFFDDDKKRADELWGDKRKENLKEGALWLFGGLFVLYLLGTVIGWIARGFAGIPQGKDTRPQ